MGISLDRRELVGLAAGGGLGIVLGSALVRGTRAQDGGPPSAAAPSDDLFFVQLADAHWGFDDPAINPDFAGTFRKAVLAINSLSRQPDFVVFTGDMTHSTDDRTERRRRMADMRHMVGRLKVKNVRFVPGEHDARADRGAAYREYFGAPYYAFDHRGYHFIVLDNASDWDQKLGATQLAWLAEDLRRLPPETPVVVFAHRPLFELYRPWGWWTPDGDRALELLRPFRPTVFYGHVHYEHHAAAFGGMHHAATSLMMPLYPAGARPHVTMVPWDKAHPYAGMGWRTVAASRKGAAWNMMQKPVGA